MYIKKTFRVEYSESGTLLNRLDFVYKKTKGVPGKAKKEDQLKFIKKLCLRRKKKSDIYFLDATHPTHNTVLSYAWIKKGEEKGVLTNSAGRRINYLGAININNHKQIIRSYKTINQFTVSRFLKDLRLQSGSSKELVVVLDQARTHQSALVKKTAKKLNITLIFLPSYSPNLNPIERYWRFFKKKVFYNKYYKTFDEFQTACASFFRSSRKYNKELSNLLTYNFHVYDFS